MDATALLSRYSGGEISLEEVNRALAEMGDLAAGLQLDPERHSIPTEEIGVFGLLDTDGLAKVEIRNMELVGAGCGDEFALCYFNGKTYEVKGQRLEEMQL